MQGLQAQGHPNKSILQGFKRQAEILGQSLHIHHFRCVIPKPEVTAGQGVQPITGRRDVDLRLTQPFLFTT